MGSDREPTADEERAARAFARARRVLVLATRPDLPAPSVELWADGSAVFRFPRPLASALAAENVTELCHLIGSMRVEPGDDDMTIAVCHQLGRVAD